MCIAVYGTTVYTYMHFFVHVMYIQYVVVSFTVEMFS